MLSENQCLFALTRLKGLGPIRINELLKAYEGSPSQAWYAIAEGRLRGTAPFLQQLGANIPSESQIISDFASTTGKDIRVCGIHEADYPPLLKETPDAPPLLYYRGQLPGRRPLLTVVGTRAMTLYGQQAVASLLAPLAAQGIGIISGLAFGVDAECHRIALGANGYTAAVLGSAPDVITPWRHEYLAHEILAANGCLISEFPSGTEAGDGSFPRRNRILAGLSPVTLVIEAAERSGALITANYALGYHREVAALPGSIFSPVSAGCHKLLHGGAALVTKPEDILALLVVEVLPQEKHVPANITVQQAAVLRLLSGSPKPVDLLAVEYDGHSAALFGILTELELLGLVKQIPGRGYVIAAHRL